MKRNITVPYNDKGLIKSLKKNPKELKEYVKCVADRYRKKNNLDVFLDCINVAILARKAKK